MSTAGQDSDQALRIKQLEAELEIAHQQLALAKKELAVQQQRLEAKRQNNSKFKIQSSKKVILNS